MRKGIHPEYKLTKITCACGNVIETRSTASDIHVEICSACHPFFTGKQKLVDTAGRIDRFNRRYGMNENGTYASLSKKPTDVKASEKVEAAPKAKKAPKAAEKADSAAPEAK